MKQPTTTQMQVTYRDGSTGTKCCGPAVTADPTVAGYAPDYSTTRYGVCCHTGVAHKTYELAEASMQPVRQWLAARAGRSS